MKIFSNFDTQLDEKLYQEFSQKYGKDKVLLLYRDKIFLILHILLPGLFYIFFVLITTLILWKIDLGTSGNKIKWILYIIAFIIISISIGRKLLKKFIDYKMDFAIITPNEIMAYNQTGIFSREARTIDVEKLKTITVDKKGFLNSIFNYGTLVFLSEGDDRGQGGIELHYIGNPDKVKRQVLDIVKFGIEELNE